MPTIADALHWMFTPSIEVSPLGYVGLICIGMLVAVWRRRRADRRGGARQIALAYGTRIICRGMSEREVQDLADRHRGTVVPRGCERW